jgi:hypothetical protein
VKYAAFHGDGRLFATPRMVDESELEGDGRTLYPGKDGYSMIEMPYRGDKLSMVVIAPNDLAGLPSIEARLNASNLAACMKSMAQREIDVFMPKFKMETFYGKLGGANGPPNGIRSWYLPINPTPISRRMKSRMPPWWAARNPRSAAAGRPLGCISGIP